MKKRRPCEAGPVETLRARVTELEALAEAEARAAAALREGMERFRAVADCTYDLESWTDPDGRLLWVNPAVERVTGYSVAECLAMADYPRPLIHEEDLKRVVAAFSGGEAASTGNDVPFRLLRKDGGAAWAAVSWQPIHAADGSYLGRRSSIRDIGDRKRAEEALLEERLLLTTVVSHIPSGIFWKGRDFQYRGCNDAFARSAGVARPEDIVGRNDYELAWEKGQADYFRACDRQVMEEDRPLLNIEEVERQADGRQAVLLTSKVPLHAADGRVTGVLGIDTDISHLKRVENELRQARSELEARVGERTAELSSANERLLEEIQERKRAEEALRASEERYRLVSELTSDYAYAFRVAPGGSCEAEWVTDAFARLTGHPPTESEGGNGLGVRVHPDDAPVVERRIRSLLSGRSTVTELRAISGDGGIRWLRDHARPIWCDREARVIRILGAAQDITDRRQAEEEARRHQEALAQVGRLTTVGELAAQLAHQLNQPLCTIVGNAQTAQRLLAAPAPDARELRDALEDIVTFGKQAASVIKRLRDFLKQQHPEPSVLNVQRTIEEIAELLEADARQSGCKVRFDVADDLPAIRGDPTQLQQVLLNLVRNALEAASPLAGAPQDVLVQARRAGPDDLVIRVIDEGAGVEPEAVERVFEPFYTTKPGGLGLGLAISRSIVEAHGGSLRLEPNADRGATFSLTLPGIAEGSP